MKTMTCKQLGCACDLPLTGMGWYRQVKRDFAALPES